MLRPPTGTLATLLHDAARAFPDRAPASILQQLSHVLAVSARLSTANEDDIIVSCDLCADDQFWRDNYGSGWAVAQWLYCGPLGLNCPPRGGLDAV